MKDFTKIYRCKTCGNIVEMLQENGGTLVCCGSEMELVKPNSTDADKAKHVPVIEKKGSGIIVKVGAVPHPMVEEHYIEWIEIMFNGKIDRQFLKPGDKPEAEFNIQDPNIKARIYCNLHGLWVSE